MAAAANRRKIPGAPGPAVGDVQQVFASLIPRRITDEKAYLSIVPIKARPIRNPWLKTKLRNLNLFKCLWNSRRSLYAKVGTVNRILTRFGSDESAEFIGYARVPTRIASTLNVK